MMTILLVSRDKVPMSALKAGLEENNARTTCAKSGCDALSMIAEREFDLVVADENLGDMTGLELIKTVVALKPSVNFAAVNSLLPDDFHEASEGSGILMQLPAGPGREIAGILLEHLKTILNLKTSTQYRIPDTRFI